MRAVVITKTGPPEVLQVQERPDPQPGSGQVAIDVHAAGVNFADTMARVGLVDRHDARIIVVGSYGEAPLKGALVGSTAHKLVHLSERPVLVVRAR